MQKSNVYRSAKQRNKIFRLDVGIGEEREQQRENGHGNNESYNHNICKKSRGDRKHETIFGGMAAIFK